jgi:hypothetical protein
VLAYAKLNAVPSTLPASKPWFGLKLLSANPLAEWDSNHKSNQAIERDISRSDHENEPSEPGGPLRNPEPSSEEGPVITLFAHDPVQNWDDPPAESPASRNNEDDVHNAGVFWADPSDHTQQHASPYILHKRPSIPRQQPPKVEPSTTTGNPHPHFPPDFPAYHCTQNMNEIAAYLANASYVAALGGPPLADLKYGIIIVPVGEEKLLFGRQQHNFVMTQEFLDAVDEANRDYDRALRMHDPDEDSAEFVRGRFEGGFASVEGEASRGVEVGLETPREREGGEGEDGEGEDGDGDGDGDVEMSQM